MAGHDLGTYLNDHLSGSVAALELLEHLERAKSGTPVAAFAAGLRAEIREDRRELEALLGRLSIAQSRTRKAAAWLAGIFSEIKLKLDDPSAGPLRELEIFDALLVGIEGKRLLWRALIAASEGRADLAGTDYARLVQRAEDQRARVETFRLEAARAALIGPTG